MPTQIFDGERPSEEDHGDVWVTRITTEGVKRWLTTKAKQLSDRSRINLNEDYEKEYWKKRFGVSGQALAGAVRAVGGVREEGRKIPEGEVVGWHNQRLTH
ncbi:DUF3606 domain-containing protein [Bradyrhizobium sp. CCGB20]|uniref:DUF3606 domain-containing protein n=1 Tax=Bradyrhizobium sp. CCGB20 TaxID=2949633 RepID=UPI0020B1A7EE|nr:DUF3606 domain-containing protein [Bradyrhizobium sp. CCGB20]MCP3397129.1 DUF3606 domain-containing protein [Bradyrhizobium sp. CCGB20]